MPLGSSSDLKSRFKPKTAKGKVLSVGKVARTSLIHYRQHHVSGPEADQGMRRSEERRTTRWRLMRLKRWLMS